MLSWVSERKDVVQISENIDADILFSWWGNSRLRVSLDCLSEVLNFLFEQEWLTSGELDFLFLFLRLASPEALSNTLVIRVLVVLELIDILVLVVILVARMPVEICLILLLLEDVHFEAS